MKRAFLFPLVGLVTLCTYSSIWAQPTATIGLETTTAVAGAGATATVYLISRDSFELSAFTVDHSFDGSSLRPINVVLRGTLPGDLSGSTIDPNVRRTNWTYGTPANHQVAPGDTLFGLQFEVLNSRYGGLDLALKTANLGYLGSDNTAQLYTSFYHIHGKISSNPEGGSFGIGAVNVQPVSCAENRNGQIAVSPIGAGPFTFQWTDPLGNSLSPAEDSILIDIPGGQYGLQITDNQDQIRRLTALIDNDSSFDWELFVQNEVCQRLVSAVSVIIEEENAADYTISWSTGDTTRALDPLLLDVGQYSVTVTNPDSSCSQGGIFAIDQSAGFELEASVVPTTCGGSSGSIQLHVVNGLPDQEPYRFIWNTGDTTASISNLNGDTYTVTVTASNGCESQEAIEVPSSSTIDLFTSVVVPNCNGNPGQILLEPPGPSADYTFQWNTGATTSTLLSLPSGTYEVTVTDTERNCMDRRQFDLPNAEPLVGGARIQCEQDTLAFLSLQLEGPYQLPLQLDFGGQVVSLQDSNDTVLLPVSDSTYSVEVTDIRNCSITFNNLLASCVPDPEPQVAIVPTQARYELRDTASVRARVTDFQRINALDFSLSWDRSQLTWLGVAFFDTTLLNQTHLSVDTSQADTGWVRLSWEAASPLNLPDGQWIYDLHFVAASEGISIIDADTSRFPVLFRELDGDILTPSFQEGRLEITPPGRELTVSICNTEAPVGTLVDVPVLIDGWENLATFDLELRWDTSHLYIEGIHGSEEHPLLDALVSSPTELQGGQLQFQFRDTAQTTFLLSDTTELFLRMRPRDTVQTAIQILGDQMEVTSKTGNPITLLVDNGSVTGIEGNVGARLYIAGAAAAPNDPFVDVPVFLSASSEISAFNLPLQWDTEVIQLEGISYSAEIDGFVTEQADTEPGYIELVLANHSFTTSFDRPSFVLHFSTAGSVDTGAIMLWSRNQSTASVSDALRPLPLVSGGGRLTTTNEEIIWPGDVDRDDRISGFDALEIGLGADRDGAARYFGTTYFTGQETPDWEMAHRDVTGNGSINQADFKVVQDRFGTTVRGSFAAVPYNSEVGIPLGLDLSPVQDATRKTVDLYLGTAQQAATQVHGLTFTLEYDPVLIDPSSVELELLDSWMGNPDTDQLWSFVHHDTLLHRFTLVLTAHDGIDREGFGAIALLRFQPRLPVDGGRAEAAFNWLDVRAVDKFGIVRELAANRQVLAFEGTTSTTEPEALKDLRLYPNPTTDRLILDTDVQINQLALLNSLGQFLMQLPPQNQVEVSRLPDGLYWLRIATRFGTVYRAFVKE